jgi:hypothetical protein
MPDKENNLDAGALQLLISEGILNMGNGHIIANTIAHNVMQENNHHLFQREDYLLMGNRLA